MARRPIASSYLPRTATTPHFGGGGSYQAKGCKEGEIHREAGGRKQCIGHRTRSVRLLNSMIRYLLTTQFNGSKWNVPLWHNPNSVLIILTPAYWTWHQRQRVMSNSGIKDYPVYIYNPQNGKPELPIPEAINL